MKTLMYSLTFILLVLAACRNNHTQTVDLKKAESAKDQTGVSTTAILNSYLKLKNALTTDNDKGAAVAGNELVYSLARFDYRSLTAEQGKLFSEIAVDAKEQAEHIADNTGNISHQRQHFVMLNKDMYDLVKLIGKNQPLFVVHCPMYDNSKGAFWLSEIKEIKNPYMGKSMSDCGSIKEELN